MSVSSVGERVPWRHPMVCVHTHYYYTANKVTKGK